VEAVLVDPDGRRRVGREHARVAQVAALRSAVELAGRGRDAVELDGHDRGQILQHELRVHAKALAGRRFTAIGLAVALVVAVLELRAVLRARKELAAARQHDRRQQVIRSHHSLLDVSRAPSMVPTASSNGAMCSCSATPQASMTDTPSSSSTCLLAATRKSWL